MNKIISIKWFILLLLPVVSAGASEFDKYLETQNNSYLKDEALFEKIKEKEKLEFEKYRKTIIKAYKQYRAEIAKFWGENNTVISSNHKWAEYFEDMEQRHVVDFKKGTVLVEVIIDKKDKDNKALIQNKLSEAIVRTVTKPADNRSVIEVAKKPAESLKANTENQKPVLAGLIKTKKGKIVTKKNAKSFADESVKKSTKLKKVKGTDGMGRFVASAKFTLIPNHIRKRAERFKKPVKKYAKEFDVPQNLIFSVIETESFFNPAARSNAPAFGLMQLVPHYGGREAYRFLHKRDQIPSEAYLYNGNKNIELGSAYLHVLYYKHMKGIKNKKSRLWCSIAAYNTGPTNVFRAVIGKYRRSVFRRYSRWKAKALREINKLSSDQLYSLLRKKLPYPETRHYIKNVRSRMGKYSSI